MTNTRVRDSELARIAVEVYQNGDNALAGVGPGFERLEGVGKSEHTHGYEDAFYYDKERNAIVMAFPGSNEPADWIDNGRTFVTPHLESRHKQQAVDQFQALIDFMQENPEYANADIYLAGHSKGGLNAQFVEDYARENNIEIEGGVTIGSPDRPAAPEMSGAQAVMQGKNPEPPKKPEPGQPSVMTHFEREGDIVTRFGRGGKEGEVVELEGSGRERGWMERNIVDPLGGPLYDAYNRAREVGHDHSSDAYYQEIKRRERLERLRQAGSNSERLALEAEFAKEDVRDRRARAQEVQDQTQKQYQGLVEQRRQADHEAENAPHPRQRGRARNDLAGLDRQLAEMERTQGMVPDHISGRPGQNSPSRASTAQSIRQSGTTPQAIKPAGSLPAAPQNSVQPKAAQAASTANLATASLEQRAAEMHKRTRQNQAVGAGNKSGSNTPKFGDALMPNPAPVLGRTGMSISENPAERSKEDTQDLLTQMPWLTDAIDRTKPIKMIQDKDIPMPKPGKVIRSTDPGGTWLMPNDRKPDEPLEVWQDRERTKLQADLKKMRADRTRFGFPP